MHVTYVRIFINILQILNSLFFQLLQSANLEFVPVVGKYFDGDYRDFNDKWYKQKAPIFIATVMFQMLSPFVTIVINYAWLTLYKWMDQGKLFGASNYPTENTKCGTIWQYYETYAGGEFYFEYQYTSTTLTLVLCFTLGPAIPILFPIGLLNLVVNYVIVNYMLTYHIRKPI